MAIVDAHCDTITVLASQKRRLGISSTRGHLDIPRLKEGGVDVQFFAIFVGPEYYNNPLEYTRGMIEHYHNEIMDNQDSIKHVQCYDEIIKVLEQERIAAILTIEGGEALYGKIENLENYYLRGVRGLTLTWNGKNDLGDGVGMAGMASGLTPFGREVVNKMSTLGMMIDISHLSEPSFWNVIAETKVPICASHSNCRAICNHSRNLTDKQIQAVGNRGGVIGVTYVPQFIDITYPNIERLLDHIDHLYNVGGISCIGLGSDFDGIDLVPEGLTDASIAVPNIERALRQRSYDSGKIEQMLGLNWLRLFKDVCG